MNSILKMLLSGVTCLALSSCSQQTNKILKQSDFTTPPSAKAAPSVFEEFGIQRIDNYFWIKDKTNPEVISYLNAENEYANSVMKSSLPLRDKIYTEIIGRIKETDESYPTLSNGYLYYYRTESGKQYRTYCRKKGTIEATEEIIFDQNKMAEGKKAFLFNGYEVSNDNTLAFYLSNETGSYAEATLKVRELSSGKDLEFSVDGVAYAAWANDNKTLFYTTVDKTLRPYRVYKHVIGKKGSDELLYEEMDPKYNLYIDKSKTKDFIFLTSSSSTTSEVQLLSANNPSGKFMPFVKRSQDVDYSITHYSDRFFIKYKDRDNLNGMIYEAPLKGYENRATWKEVVAHDPAIRIEGVDVQNNFLLLEVRKNGLNEINLINISTGKRGSIAFPEPVYNASLRGNPEFNGTTIRYSYTSLNRPTTLFEYNLLTAETKKLKEQEVPCGFNPNDYTVERIWADAPDGVKVPMAIVYKKGLKKNGENPALLYSYGSYGSSSDAYFSPSYYSLIDRGFIIGIAQIRGGSDLGEQWYEDGKLLKKKNTFTDFIACSEKLISDKYTSPKKLAAMGGSAGGLLVGAVANMRPDLYISIIAEVPFVDVINTMLDSSLPLTTQEYEEWGNPNIEEYYKYLISYSPYDNIKAQNYPNMFITGGLNDSQVGFHEPAKFVAKLRTTKTDDNIVLLYTNMESGHGGATGRYDNIKEIALQWAFLLNRVGISE